MLLCSLGRQPRRNPFPLNGGEEDYTSFVFISIIILEVGKRNNFLSSQSGTVRLPSLIFIQYAYVHLVAPKYQEPEILPFTSDMNFTSMPGGGGVWTSCT